MKKTTLLSIASAVLLSACGSDSDPAPAAPSLTFQGNGAAAGGAFFNGPHAGQTVRAALLDGATVVDLQKATIAATGTDPAFSFTFSPVDRAKAYTVEYWIDSNFGLTAPAGAGECNPPANDHQWSVAIPAGQLTLKDTHRPGAFTPVCGTFTFPLTFQADASFVAAHAGKGFTAALVRGTETAALETQTGTIAAAPATTAFSVTFAKTLVIGEPYSVKLWVDVNGNATCDGPALAQDHAWSVDVQTSLAGHPTAAVSYAHNTSFAAGVCSFFP